VRFPNGKELAHSAEVVDFSDVGMIDMPPAFIFVGDLLHKSAVVIALLQDAFQRERLARRLLTDFPYRAAGPRAEDANHPVPGHPKCSVCVAA